jgi:predicted nucleotidyltransferase
MTINNEIEAIKNIILKSVDCEKIFLFGSFSRGTQQEGSDYDFYVVLKNEDENPVFAEQNIYRNLSKRKGQHTPIDILAENSLKFNNLSVLPTMERKIIREGVLLYDTAGLAMCMELDSSFSTILELCDCLNPYGVTTRYPKEKEITGNMTRTAIDQAEKVKDFCWAKLPKAQV